MLDLPPEIRQMIFRHLLVYSEGTDGCMPCLMRRSALGILSTSRLIHGEAFNVLYSENQFTDEFWLYSVYQARFIAQLPRVIKAIKNIQIRVGMWLPSPKLLRLVNLFGDQTIIRGTLAIELGVKGRFLRLLKWYVRALGRFTNFRTVELYFHELNAPVDNLLVREYLQTNLKPVLGCAEGFEKRCHYLKTGLRFHPTNHPYLRRNPDSGDWASFLDGIRLKWNGT